jgi:hypothetical protein
LEAGIRAWGAGLYAAAEGHVDPPEESVLNEFVKTRLEQYAIEAALLERGGAGSHAAFVEVPEPELEAALAKFR